MGLKPSYPSVVPGQGFCYVHEASHSFFQSHTLSGLHQKVSDFAKANGFTYTNDEFDENVCRNTPNLPCTEGIRGMGDAVHMVLNPVARVIDSLTGSNLQGCGGCRDRQEAMNKL